MTSVKGMAWGTPEFIAIAKTAEAEGEEKATVERLIDELEKAEMSNETWNNARDRVACMFELCDGDCPVE